MSQRRAVDEIPPEVGPSNVRGCRAEEVTQVAEGERAVRGAAPTRVFVGIGSNVDPECNVRTCLQSLRARFGRVRASTVYRSRPVGFSGDDFYNLVVMFETQRDVRAVRAALKDIEREHGRTRSEARYSPRTLDLDLLLFGTLVLEEGGFILPHPDIDQYAFVLRPLAELAGDLTHPTAQLTFSQRWREFAARGEDLRAVRLKL